MKNILAILILTIFIFGCGVDESLLNPSITLISPIDETVDYCDIQFKWEEKRVDGNFVLDISTTINFDDVIFSDTTNNTTYIMDKVLQPNKKYFWRVTLDEVVKIGEFETKEQAVLSDYNGIFTMARHIHSPGDFPVDTYDTITAQINFSNNIPKLSHTVTIEPKYFNYENSSCSSLNYSNEPDENGEIFYEVCILNTVERTFYFSRGNNRAAGPSSFTTYKGNID